MLSSQRSFDKEHEKLHIKNYKIIKYCEVRLRNLENMEEILTFGVEKMSVKRKGRNKEKKEEMKYASPSKPCQNIANKTMS